jgi:hypothetical protein
MVDKTNARRPGFMKPAFLGTEFNGFLFAAIGTDASGTPLTVLSALARLDLDPWAEAASLARLPGGIATQKLAALISRFPEISPVRVDSAKIAARLTALLPGTLRGVMPVRGLAVQALHPAAQTLMAPRSIFLLMSLTLAVMLATQFLIAPDHASGISKTIAPTAMRFNPATRLPAADSPPRKTEN